MAKTLEEHVIIRTTEMKNRMIAGPMGNSTATGEDGVVNDAIVAHFRAVAEGGAALIVQGAASVTNENKAHLTQTGIWSDTHVPGLRRITEAVRAAAPDCKIILQLEHAGIRALATEPFSPSPFTLRIRDTEKACHVMTVDDIRDVEQLYINAGRRAEEAGYDGIELHASHGWLLSAFLSPCINYRDDEYGRDKLLLLREIYARIREIVSENFIIGVRLAGFNPDLETGIAQGKALEEIGFDYINMSNNPVTKWLPQDMTAPEGYPFTAQEYAAAEMKKAVSIPVVGGKFLRTPEEVNAVLAETNIDMVTLGRQMLADPYWTEKALSGGEIVLCRHCPGRCKWKLGGENCAAIAQARRGGEIQT